MSKSSRAICRARCPLRTIRRVQSAAHDRGARSAARNLLRAIRRMIVAQSAAVARSAVSIHMSPGRILYMYRMYGVLVW